MTNSNTPHRTTPGSRRRLFAVLVGLGVLGIAGGVPLNATLIAEAAPGESLPAVLLAASVSLLVPVVLGRWPSSRSGRGLGFDGPVLRAMTERRPPGSAPTRMVWASIVLAALAFGALHLPATAVLILEPLAIVRALLLNAPSGSPWAG